jgi:hypothetical protein
MSRSTRLVEIGDLKVLLGLVNRDGRGAGLHRHDDYGRDNSSMAPLPSDWVDSSTMDNWPGETHRTCPYGDASGYGDERSATANITAGDRRTGTALTPMSSGAGRGVSVCMDVVIEGIASGESPRWRGGPATLVGSRLNLNVVLQHARDLVVSHDVPLRPLVAERASGRSNRP